jgi:putative transposase
MPRKPRFYLPGVTCHVVQRGNNRSCCFFSDSDYQLYLGCLEHACNQYEVALHAYVLMTNHCHLLMTPETKDGISKVMQSVGRRYVQYVNKSYGRSGTLWEGRHKASLVDTESYLLACYRYIELNPVRAGMVKTPGDYPWSSFHVNANGDESSLITPHTVYLALDRDQTHSCARYRKLFEMALDKGVLNEIRTATEFSMPLGNDRFKEEIEAALDLKVGHAKRGRPAKQDGEG